MSLLKLESNLDAAAALLVEELIDQLQAGEADVEAFLAAHPEHAPTLRRLLPALRIMADLSNSPAGEGRPFAGDAAALGELGDFRLLREVGRGGMGVVYEAEQISLGRRVALKVLPFAATMDPRHLQRFHNEARAAACLHHPHIVPVHGVGCERAVHFYAMQFIEGQTLAELIARRHQAAAPTDKVASPEEGRDRTTPYVSTVANAPGSTDPGPRDADYYRRVAEWGIQAAEALEHAHSLGIVHRDVKPGNLMVDARGELWVTDFGLARTADSGLTMSGDLLGTLRYMSPEQAMARHGLVDHRTDVYSLGATLYEQLTLEPAFDGADRQELLRQIAFEEPRPPRRRNRAIPVELETILLKALEKNPAARYATAQEFADDLRRFLEDQPIRARRPTLRQRAVKWTRRHRSVVWSVLAALVVGLVATAWQAVRATDAEQKAQAALEKLEQEQDRTTAALTEARQAGRQTLEALRALTDELFAGHLGAQVQLTDQDRAFLRKVLEQYEGFAATKGDGEESRAIRAEGYYRVGRIHDLLGERKEARSAYERAVALFEQLAADFPAVPTYGGELALSHKQLGSLLADLGQYAKAKAEYLRAITLQEQLVADLPTVPEYRSELAASHNNLGLLLRAQGKWAEAEAEYRRALEFQKQLAADFPAVPAYRDYLAHHRNNLGILLAGQGRRAQAEAELQQALVLRKQLVADSPTVPGYRQTLARCHNNLGLLLGEAGKDTEAEAEHRQAIALSRRLAADFPTVPHYREYLAHHHNSLGVVLWNLGKPAEAEAEWRRALDLLKRLADDLPTVPEYRHNLAGSHHNLAHRLAGLGKHGEAEAEYRQAIALSRRLAADFPTVSNYRQFLANHHNNLGILLKDLGKPLEAEAEHRQAIALRKQLGADAPTVLAYQITLGGSYCNLGSLVRDDGRPAEALPWFDQAIHLLAPMVEREPRLAGAKQFLCNSHEARAKALMRLNRMADAARDLDRAVELAEASRRPALRLQRALCRAWAEPTKAVAEAEAVLQDGPPSSNLLYDAACVYALSAARSRDAAATDQYAARAVALLQQARQKGYFDSSRRIEQMTKDPGLVEPLRGRADFRKLLAELEASKK
jgi:serine/threonine protein kinase/Tfp pilus assembly protein PilF